MGSGNKWPQTARARRLKKPRGNKDINTNETVPLKLRKREPNIVYCRLTLFKFILRQLSHKTS